jgi:hypothetical protein
VSRSAVAAFSTSSKSVAVASGMTPFMSLPDLAWWAASRTPSIVADQDCTVALRKRLDAGVRSVAFVPTDLLVRHQRSRFPRSYVEGIVM